MTGLDVQASLEEAASTAPGQATRRPALGRLGRSILWRFSLFAALALAIMSATGLYAAWRHIEDVRQFQEEKARWGANSVDGWFQDLESLLRTAAQYPQLVDLSPEGMEEFLRGTMERSPALYGVALIDARSDNAGIELMRVEAGGSFSGSDRSAEEWYDLALNQGHHISPAGYSRSSEPIVILSQAVEQDGQVVAVIAAEVNLSWAYGPPLRQLRSEETGGYIYVVTEQGQAMLHENTPFVFDRQSHIEVEGIRAAIHGQSMPLFYDGLNHLEQKGVTGAYQPIQKLPWYAIAEQPTSWIIKGLRPLVLAVVGVLLLSASAAAVIGWHISRRMAAPIVYLREEAQRIGAGDLAHRIALPGHNELSDLAAELNQMAESLRDSRAQQEAWSHELEERVNQRTLELSHAFEQQQALLQTIQQMSCPVIPVMEGILVTPLVGALDSERAQRVMEDLLAGIERERARVAILDITGLAVVDTVVASALLQAARAAQLLGARPILVGIAPEVAETLVQLGIEIHDLCTAATLQEGLQLALSLLRRRVTNI